MAVIYEINPPRVPGDATALAGLERRVSQIAGDCDGIHITESVLGTARLSPIVTASALRKAHPGLEITASMRVIDKDASAVERYMEDAIGAGLDGILVLKGDPLRENPSDSGLVPSRTVAELQKRCAGRIKLFLSIPSNPDFGRIKKKISARPSGFITQVIQSTQQVSRICGALNPMGFRVIPIVLLPSEKNAKSAGFLGIDWSGYRDDAAGFVSEVHDIAGDVLITSPNDFELARKILGCVHG